MTTTIVYKSTDTSAPTYTGQVGSLITLLDACLVNGYGSKAAAGWTKSFTGTNAASYRMGGGNQLYLDVNDNGPGAGAAKEARMRGYEVMTAVATGTGLFPTVAQLAAGIVCRKSNTADGTARPWIVVADDRTFYLYTLTGDVANAYTVFGFGDFFSFLSSDNYRVMIFGRATENSAAAQTEDTLSATLSVQTGHYVARAETGLGGSVQCCFNGDNAAAGGSTLLRGQYTFPNPADGGFHASPIYISTGTNTRRGRLRGFVHQLHQASGWADGDTLDNTLTGKSYLLLKGTYGSATLASFCQETSSTWDTNV